MNQSTPPVQSGPTVSVRWLVVGILVCGFLPMLADRYVYDHWMYANVYDHDWARLLRVMGFLPTWALAALALWLHERQDAPHRASSRAWYLVGAPLLGGLGAELGKLMLRRERPSVLAGAYSFRAWSDHPFSTSGLAWPSSHTMVAFAAAGALAHLFPRARWVWYGLAAGCGVTRILAQAHFVSDVTLGAFLGWGVAWGLARSMRTLTAEVRAH